MHDPSLPFLQIRLRRRTPHINRPVRVQRNPRGAQAVEVLLVSRGKEVLHLDLPELDAGGGRLEDTVVYQSPDTLPVELAHDFELWYRQ